MKDKKDIEQLAFDNTLSHRTDVNQAFIKGYELAQQSQSASIQQAVDIINYIENDAEIGIPIEDLVGEHGIGLTKKDYGLVLLKHLVIELRNRFLPSPPQLK